MEKLTEKRDQPTADSSVQKLLSIIVEMDRSGIMDIIYRMLADEDVTSAIKKMLSSGFLMNLIENSEVIMNSLTTIDLSMFPHYTNAIKSVEIAIKTEDVEPVGGLKGILDKMKDEDTQKGIGIVFSLLKSLGRTCSEVEGCPFQTEENDQH
ncbi:DUF1641 domain-containing protein [Thermoplasma sp.]|uniref:DUF1641 domain-containing protein n=1 Tax=Thermoplasma sp. TaxID=1973142 RepID=UPI0025D409C8|nr:DUF1641 domain-containing protein [Thermoplasma sp.]